MYCSSRVTRFGLSPDSSSLTRSSLPATYCSRNKAASCFCCASTVLPSASCCWLNWCRLTSVCCCSSDRSCSERSACEIATSACASESVAWLLALSVRSMSDLRAFSFFCKSLRSVSAALFWRARSVDGAAQAGARAAANSSATAHTMGNFRPKVAGYCLINGASLSRSILDMAGKNNPYSICGTELSNPPLCPGPNVVYFALPWPATACIAASMVAASPR